MAEPVIVNFTLWRGVRRVLRITMTTNGSVSGYTTKFSARKKGTDADPLVLDLDGAILDAGSSTTPGIFTVTFTKAISITLGLGPYDYSFERVDTNNEDLFTTGVMDVKPAIRSAVS